MQIDGAFLKESLFKRTNMIFISFLALFLILGGYLLNFYQYDLINKDIISMISVARLYYAGDLASAINGYWGPLFSWLLVPFIMFNPSPTSVLYSTKVLSLIFGFFTIIGIRFLSYRFEMDEKIRTSILFAMVFVILHFALNYSPVDLILACFLVYYLYFIFSPEYYNKWYNGMLCGILCGLAYLTKSYIFPFFIAHFILFNLFHYLQEVQHRRAVLKNLLLGLAVFFIISGAWSLIISEKYGEVTFGTSGTYNHNVEGPESVGHPTEYVNEGFIKPPYENVTSAWEDPTYLNVKSWSPFQSWSYFNYQINKINYNISILKGIYQSFSYFALIIILIYVLLCIKPIRNQISTHIPIEVVLYPVLTVLIYSAGYLSIVLEPRYLWIVYILLMLMGGYLLNLLFKHHFFTKKLNKIAKHILTIVLIGSFLIMPISGLISFHYIGVDGGYVGKDSYDLGNSIENIYPVHGHIASNGNAEDTTYRRALHLSYFIGTSYYGFSKPNETDTDLQADFKKYDIDYYFVWGKSNNEALLSKYKEVIGGKIGGLRIYAVKESS
jgi:hypothetical protein